MVSTTVNNIIIQSEKFYVQGESIMYQLNTIMYKKNTKLQKTMLCKYSTVKNYVNMLVFYIEQ